MGLKAANDNDDEVRDRVGLYSAVLTKCVQDSSGVAMAAFKPMMSAEMPFSMDALYDGLEAHLDSEDREQPFSVSDLPSDEAYKATAKAQAALVEKKPKPGAAPAPAAA